MDKPVCEVCGAPAVHAEAVGIKETNWDTGVIEVSPSGTIRYFCEEHKQKVEPIDLSVSPLTWYYQKRNS